MCECLFIHMCSFCLCLWLLRRTLAYAFVTKCTLLLLLKRQCSYLCISFCFFFSVVFFSGVFFLGARAYIFGKLWQYYLLLLTTSFFFCFCSRCLAFCSFFFTMAEEYNLKSLGKALKNKIYIKHISFFTSPPLNIHTICNGNTYFRNMRY